MKHHSKVRQALIALLILIVVAWAFTTFFA